SDQPGDKKRKQDRQQPGEGQGRAPRAVATGDPDEDVRARAFPLRRDDLRFGTRMFGRPISAAIVVTVHAQRCIPAPPERNAVLRAATSPRLPPRTYGRRVAPILVIRSSPTPPPTKRGRPTRR